MKAMQKIIPVLLIAGSSFLFGGCATATDYDRSHLYVREDSHRLFGVYDYPRFLDRPCYFYRGRYYYGGQYRHGYYDYRGRRLRHGHYYHRGYRYRHPHYRESYRYRTCKYEAHHRRHPKIIKRRRGHLRRYLKHQWKQKRCYYER